MSKNSTPVSATSGYFGFLSGFMNRAASVMSVQDPEPPIEELKVADLDLKSPDTLSIRLVNIGKIGKPQVNLKITYTPSPDASDSKFAIRSLPILVLDISSSMGGQPIDCGREAFADMIVEILKTSEIVYFITYGSYSKIYEINNDNSDRMIPMIRNIKTSGMTNFHDPLVDIQNIVRQNIHQYGYTLDIRIMFFTDGQGSLETHRVPATLVQTQTILQDPRITAAGGRSTLFCRGFSINNDIGFMDQLTALGATPGDYDYASTAAEIRRIVVDTPDFTSAVRTVSIHVVDSKGVENKFDGVTMNPVIDPEAKENVNLAFEASFFIPIEMSDDQSLSVTASVGEYNMTQIVSPQEIPPMELACVTLDAVENRYAQIALQVVQLLNSRQWNEDLDAEVQTLNDFLTEFFEGPVRALPKIIRKRISQRITAMKSMLMNFREKSREIRLSGDRGAISQLMASAHVAKKRSLKRLVMNREEKGRSNMEIAENKLASNAETMTNEQKIELNKSELCDNINLVGLGDAVAEEATALCLTGRMTRPEAAIGNGALVCFHELYPTECTISFDLFTETLQIKVNKDGDYDPEDVHNGWGFEFKDNGGVMKNAYRKCLNFAYPLYGHALHWENAKLLMPQALAFMGSLNFAAHTFSYIKTIPFVIVEKAVRDLAERVNDTHIQTFMSLARVAYQLILDNRMKTVSEDFVKFLTSPKHRTASDIKDSGNVCIPTMNVFLAKLMFMKDRPDLTEAFFAACIEEIVRRKMGNRKHVALRPDSRMIAELHYYKTYIQVPHAITNSAEAPFREAFLRRSGKKEEVKEEVKEEPSMAEQIRPFTSKNHDLTPGMMAIVGRVQDECAWELQQLQMFTQFYYFVRDGRLEESFKMLDTNLGVITPEIVQLFKSDEKSLIFNISDKPNFADFLPSMTAKQVYTHSYHMILQNEKHLAHGDRIASVNEKTYIDPFGPDSHNIVESIVNSEIKGEIGRANIRITEAMNGVFSTVFRDTTDITVAVGVLLSHCKNVGDSAFWQLISVLSDQDNDTPLHFEKVYLLVEWRYKNIVIYCVRKGNKKRVHYRWPASYTKATRLMRANRAIRQRQNIAVEAKAAATGIAPAVVPGDAKNPFSGLRSDPESIQTILTTDQWFDLIFRYVDNRAGGGKIRVGAPKKTRVRG
jgi:hypothetical protein